MDRVVLPGLLPKDSHPGGHPPRPHDPVARAGEALLRPGTRPHGSPCGLPLCPGAGHSHRRDGGDRNGREARHPRAQRGGATGAGVQGHARRAGQDRHADEWQAPGRPRGHDLPRGRCGEGLGQAAGLLPPGGRGRRCGRRGRARGAHDLAAGGRGARGHKGGAAGHGGRTRPGAPARGGGARALVGHGVRRAFERTPTGKGAD
mmetsp:Transcript_22952/g.72660  ORF Transcript_22952/g.72660 Transcript_22952/m.72660 type:complete len:204 (+) Transcript_22952:1193-1804(+)